MDRSSFRSISGKSDLSGRSPARPYSTGIVAPLKIPLNKEGMEAGCPYSNSEDIGGNRRFNSGSRLLSFLLLFSFFPRL
jgi:hypothetical protein